MYTKFYDSVVMNLLFIADRIDTQFIIELSTISLALCSYVYALPGKFPNLQPLRLFLVVSRQYTQIKNTIMLHIHFITLYNNIVMLGKQAREK